jgi:hypothetical protein
LTAEKIAAGWGEGQGKMGGGIGLCCREVGGGRAALGGGGLGSAML